MTDGALYRTKIHCYFLDQTRVIRPLPDEKNYHIFYQMLAGLSHDERGNMQLITILYQIISIIIQYYTNYYYTKIIVPKMINNNLLVKYKLL